MVLPVQRSGAHDLTRIIHCVGLPKHGGNSVASRRRTNVEDTTGKGHLSQHVEGKIRHSIFVPVE
jgi:hypothetical protein